MRGLLAVATFAVAGLAAACGSGGADASSAPQRAQAGSPHRAKAKPQRQAQAQAQAGPRVIASGLHVPWGIAFLPSGAALVAERTTGNIVRIPAGGGAKRVVMHVPGVDTRDNAPLGGFEGGLLGLAVSPAYERDHLVYAYFSSGHDNRIVRFRLGGKLHPILTGLGKATVHNGGRIAFGPDGKLYATVGENGEGTPAQSLKSRNGKILRINPDGSIPRSNPFKGSPIWSYGHRNPQGLAWDRRGRLWSAELGQNTTDEVNLIHKGRNYGWPRIEGRGRTHGGRYVNPKVTWTPTSTCSPSGDAIAHSTLYVACLSGSDLYRIRLHGTRPGRKVKLYRGQFDRLRTVVVAPSGRLWISTSNRDGRNNSPAKDDDRIISVPAS